MKKKFLCTLSLGFLLNNVKAQDEISVNKSSAINWATGLNWQQVKAKAKKENKYIFVDAFTTWCKPCREMDVKVYSIDSVGALMNKEFISVKIQMDQTKNDNAEVRSWYKTASDISNQYRISAYPSYVFFAPSGEVVSKEVGFKEAPAFIQAARNAKDPSKQYFVLLKKYKTGKLDHASTVSLINIAKQIGDSADYQQLLTSYYSYLKKLPKEKLYTKENIEFIANTIEKSNNIMFSMFYPDGKEVNRVMQNNWYAQKVADKIIFKEKANPFLAANEGKPEPDWNILYKSTAKDFKSDYADRTVLDAKMRWYYFYGNMQGYARALNDKVEKYGTDTTSKGEDFKLNNNAFLIWKAIDDATELKRMIQWMEGVVRRGEKLTDYYLEYWPLYLDTYANLFYSTGQTKEALKWEELAVAKSKQLNIGKGDIETIQYNFDQMKKGERVKPVKAN